MTQNQSLISNYIDDVERALQAGALYSALALALALPDICASMHLRKDNEKTGTGMRHYVRWCGRYMRLFQNRPRTRKELRPYHVYALRCAFLHNGTARMGERHNRSRGKFQRINLIWEGPEPHPSMIFTMSAPGFTRRRDIVCQMDAALVCRSIAHAASSWLASTKPNPVVQRNLASLVGIEDRQSKMLSTR